MKNKTLNIIFLDFDDIKNPLLGAGQARATVEVGKRLASKGHTITSICARYPKYKDRMENGIYYKHIGLGTSNIRLNNLAYILLLPLTVMHLKGDIVIECFTAPTSTIFSPLFTKIPVVALTTSFEAERFAKLYHLPFDKIENFGLKAYKYFMPYTKFLDKKIKKVNKNAITQIIPEGVGEEFFKIKKQKSEYILFLGRYDIGQKGIDLLLNAYKKAGNKIKYPLLLVGVGPDERKIKNLVEKLQIGNKVTVEKAAYGKAKAEILSKAAFVAFPSRHEGFSLFSLEALASGLFLVAFDIPSLAWASSKVCLKAKKFSIDSYSKLLIKASDDKLNKEMSIVSRQIAKRYTWDKVSSAYESFFMKIVDKYEH